MQTAIIIIVSAVLLIFQEFKNSVDTEIETLAFKTRGEISPDTNIIIIHFSKDDIARIGPWPIKRNYYALLINQLSNLGVKKIGLEIFLSSRFVTQSVYDNLLRTEIEKSGRVVLSSIAGKITEINHKFYTDSLSFASPKLIDEQLLTGHINYLKDYDLIIPLEIINRDIHEKAFAYQITEMKSDKKYVIVNFVSGWEKLRKYSALEFAQLYFDKSSELNDFKNKIIIIGVSDNQFAQTIQTPFDDQLPGVALHAFVLDNLIQGRSIQDDYYLSSIVLFPMFLLGFIYLKSNKKIVASYILVGILFFLLIFFAISEFYLKISSSFFIVPFISLIVFESFKYIRQRQKVLKGATDEATLLRNLLVSKERELSTLQKELNESGEESVQLSSKIELLRKDIKRLKENEDDSSKAILKIERKQEDFYGLIYVSASMGKVVELIKKTAPTDSTVLISGESGTGKELVARAIHSLSQRKDQNFVAVNCSALIDSLLESELFGHVKGSFTGATYDKQGRFELADNGTIFLDEIGETSENFQVKILRVLQSGDIEKVGSTKMQKVNVRVVAATNKNLSELVKEKKFREDLYYRLNVINIEVPPLRERKEDINAIANSFLQTDAPEISLSKAVLKALNDYQWKGNVRELESVIKRAIIFAKSEKRNLIRLSDLPKEIVKETRYGFDDLVLESLRRRKFSHSSIAETAKELGNVNRTMVSENLRGMVLKSLIENEFNIEKSILAISGIDEKDVNERVRVKIQTFLNNIQSDIDKSNRKDFETLKKLLASKYKNLPVKFHFYLDEVIKHNSK